jgi:hypothetical protein
VTGLHPDGRRAPYARFPLHAAVRVAIAPAVPGAVRCECLDCGAHVTAVRFVKISGSCGNCRSYRIAPLIPPR